MPLCDLLEVPENQSDWEQYGFNNRSIITTIRQAIQSKLGIRLNEYQLYPILTNNPGSFQFWLVQNTQAHDDFNSVLDLQSSDLSRVDINNRQQLEAWVYLNYSELNNACNKLGVS